MLAEVQGLFGRARALLVAAALPAAVALPAAAATAEPVPPDQRLEVTSFRNQELEAYPALRAAVAEGWVIPGLAHGFVPQGVSRVPGTDWMLISGYFGETYTRPRLFRGRWARVRDKRTAVYLVRHPDGAPARLALLDHALGNPMHLHAGGVAVTGRHFWIPGLNRLYRFSLDELVEADEPVIHLRPDAPAFKVDAHGSILSAWGDYLLVGDFILGRRHAAAHRRSPDGRQHAWTAAYRIDPDTGEPAGRARHPIAGADADTQVLTPDFVLHHGERAQGIALRDDGWAALSISYGNRDSRIAFHRVGQGWDPAAAPQSVELPDGARIPSWTLSDANLVRVLRAPPGSEGLDWRGGGRLAVAFEGGAYPYRKRWTRLEDRVLVLDLTLH